MTVKTQLISIFFMSFLALSLLFPVQPVLADDVQIATQGGTMFLTTTTTGTNPTNTSLTATDSTLVATDSAGFLFGGSSIPLPPGFFTSAGELVSQLIKVIMVVSVVLVFAFLVIGGIEYITSGGEKGKTEAARNKITSAIIGLIIVASSYAILTIAIRFIGFHDVSGLLDVNINNSATSSAQTASSSSPLKQLLQ